MGGDITVMSRLGQGSRFRFETPIEPDPAVSGGEQSAPHQIQEDGAEPRYPMVALPQVSPEQLKRLPCELIHQLQNAVQTGDKDRLDYLVQRVEEYDQQAARALGEFAENYQYDDLTRLLAETREKLQP
jgi:hypothetical protein